MWTCANALTLSRFVTAPVFLGLVLCMAPGRAGVDATAAALLTVTLLSDVFDGWLARRNDQVTNFGKIMDPVADSTFFLTALFAFTASDRFQVPVWLPLVVLYREVGMHVLRRYAALRGVVLAAKTSGKAKMVVQSVALCCVVAAVWAVDLGWAPVSESALRSGVMAAVGLIAVVNVLSVIEYLGEIPRLRSRPRA